MIDGLFLLAGDASIVKSIGLSRAAKLCEARIKVVRGRNERRLLVHEMKAYMKYYLELRDQIRAAVATSQQRVSHLTSRSASTLDDMIHEAYGVEDEATGRYLYPHANVDEWFVRGHIAVMRRALAFCRTQIARGQAAFCRLGANIELEGYRPNVYNDDATPMDPHTMGSTILNTDGNEDDGSDDDLCDEYIDNEEVADEN